MSCTAEADEPRNHTKQETGESERQSSKTRMRVRSLVLIRVIWWFVLPDCYLELTLFSKRDLEGNYSVLPSEVFSPATLKPVLVMTS